MTEDQPPQIQAQPHEITVDQSWIPYRAYPGDAGFDLFCQQDTMCWPDQFLDIPCGVRVALPEGWWGMLTGRSSTLRHRGLLVHTAVIDQGYRGPLFAGVWNLTGAAVKVLAGERIAQLIPVPLFPGGVAIAAALAITDRDQLGFGSSGA